MFRKATMNDWEAVYQLICDLEKTEFPKEKFREIFHEQLHKESCYCLVCEREGKTIAMLNLRFENQLHHTDRIAEIMEFVVDEKYRNKGIGKQMFDKACVIAKDNGCVQIELTSNQIRKDAHRFYIRKGMQNTHYKFCKPL